MFAYCLNNPVIFVDPYGRAVLTITVGAAYSFAQAAVTVAVAVVAVVGFCALAVAAYKLGQMTADAVSDLWARVAYSRGKGQSKRISKSQASRYAVPQPPFNDDDDDDDDYFDNDDNFGGKQKIGKSKGRTPQNNQDQNAQFEAAVNKLGLSPKESDILHRLISGQGYGYQEIIEFAANYFNLNSTNTRVILYE